MTPPAVSGGEIRSLLSSRGYDPSLIGALESYLDAQVTGDVPYHFDSIRTLVKLYGLYPDRNDDGKILTGLVLALLRYPSTDLLALQYMVPHLFAREPFSAIRKCGDLLDGCKYGEFWKRFEELQRLGGDDIAVANLTTLAVPQVRASILGVLALTYREAPGSVVTAALNVDSVSAVEAMNHPSVEKVSGDVVIFKPTPENTKRQSKYQEGVSFSTITNLIGKMAQQQ